MSRRNNPHNNKKAEANRDNHIDEHEPAPENTSDGITDGDAVPIAATASSTAEATMASPRSTGKYSFTAGTSAVPQSGTGAGGFHTRNPQATGSSGRYVVSSTGAESSAAAPPGGANRSGPNGIVIDMQTLPGRSAAVGPGAAAAGGSPARPRVGTGAAPRGGASYVPSGVASDAQVEDYEWEDIQEVRTPRDSLALYKKEIATVVFLLVIGIICLIVGLTRLAGDDSSSSALVLVLIGALTLIPGTYYAIKFVRAYRNGVPFSLFMLPN
jgi:hypothetical protein